MRVVVAGSTPAATVSATVSMLAPTAWRRQQRSRQPAPCCRSLLRRSVRRWRSRSLRSRRASRGRVRRSQIRRIEANDEPAYLVLGANDVRLRPRGRVIARRVPFVLLRAERPYTAAWATRGLTLDGWTRHNRPATLRLFAGRRAMSALHRVTMTLSAVGVVEFRTFRLRSGSAETSGRLVPGAAGTGELDVCVPANGFVDVLIEASPAGLVPGLPIAHEAELTRRPAGLQLLGISTVQRGRCSARR